MTLIKSISGIRGTIGGKPGEALTPLDCVRFVSAFARFIKQKENKKRITIVVGRDARISGEMVDQLVCGTLMGCGADVVNIGMATTPTVEMAVTAERADGGIILTASHNPAQWNALKLLNRSGEFLSAADGEQLLQFADAEDFDFVDVHSLGHASRKEAYGSYHIQKILKLPYVDVEAIKKAGFRVVIDCVNSVGGLVIPGLLEALGVKEVRKLYCDANGHFPHNPEPLPEHLGDISKLVKDSGAHCGFVVDPDVDRLAVVCEDGSMFGEEYTLVAVSDYILGLKKGNTVSNLSSSRALKDITEKHGGKYFASAVGEVNVVEKMKQENAVIGGEGNGGVILPDLHYGRDALVGIAIFLTHMAKCGKRVSQLRKSYPDYVMSKNKVNLSEGMNPDAVLKKLEEKYKNMPVTTVDGVRIDFPDGWVHLRKSNTEPIIRIYSEAPDETRAKELAQMIMNEIQ